MGTNQLLAIGNAIINPAQVILATWHEDESLILTMTGDIEHMVQGTEATLIWNALMDCCRLQPESAPLMTVR